MSTSPVTWCGVPSITVHSATLTKPWILPTLLVELVAVAAIAATPGGVPAVMIALLVSSVAVTLIQAAAVRAGADGPGPADLVTGMRLAIAIGVGTLAVVADPSGLLLAGLILLAVSTDALDGWIARRTRTSSRFGARFDLETDTALLAAAALAAMAFTGPAVLVAPLLRPFWVVLGRFLPWLDRPLPPSWRRKTLCALPIVLLVMVPWPLGGTPFAAPVALLAVASLAISFAIDFVGQWHRRSRMGSRR